MKRITILAALMLGGCTWAVGYNDIETAEKHCEAFGGIKYLERDDANHISVECMDGERVTVVQVRSDWPREPAPSGPVQP